jgi:hypothetical protein
VVVTRRAGNAADSGPCDPMVRQGVKPPEPASAPLQHDLDHVVWGADEPLGVSPRLHVWLGNFAAGWSSDLNMSGDLPIAFPIGLLGGD